MRAWLRGLAAGLATVAAMELAAPLAGVRPLPEVLEDPILAVLPGPVFGFLIDNLQHAGKVVEEIGLLALLAAALGALAGAAPAARRRLRLPHAGLAAGAAAWLVICGVLLPLGGAGFLGLADGVTTPLVWAVLMAIYAALVEWLSAAPPAPDGELDPGRRRIATWLPAGLGALALAAVAGTRGPGWLGAVLHPVQGEAGRPPSPITPPDQFYVVSKNFQDPNVAASGWSLAVNGLAAASYRLTLDALRALPATIQDTTLECISNNVGGPQMSTGTFAGVPIRDLIARAQPSASARAVNFKSVDGYTESMPLDEVMANADILVAHTLDGQPLTAAHGFPARVLIPGRYGMRGPKWLVELTLGDREQGGYWEGQGWTHDATVKTTARIDVPQAGALLRRGTVALAGVAFAGRRGISRVEVSTDGGRSWSDAQLQPPTGPLTWVLWSYSWAPAAEGAHTLIARATDARGAPQPAEVRPSFPDGSSGHHRVTVTVTR